MRAAIDRALAAGLTPTELRVFLAVVKLMPLYDVVEDRIANRQLVEATQIDGRHVRRALGRLHEVGVIEREPGRGQTASLIRLPWEGAEPAPFDLDIEGAEPAPSEGAGLAPGGGGRSEHPEGATFDTRGGGYAPASESLPSICPEEGRATSIAALLNGHTPELLGEARAVVDMLAAEHSTAAVDAALSEMVALGWKMRWPSDLRNGIRSRLTTPHAPRTTSGPDDEPVRLGCDDCDGGWVFPQTDRPGEPVAACPTCLPQHVVPASQAS